MAVGEILDNKGLQGLWHLNGNWSDFSSNGYALTPTNTPIGTKGKFGSAFQFSSASSQYATIAAASAPNLEITGVQTGICWFNPTTSNSFQELFGKNNAGNTINRYLSVDGSARPRVILTGVTGGDLTATATVTNGVWHFLAYVYDGSNLSLWVNLTKKSQSASGTCTALATTGWSIGRGGDFNGEYTNGVVDEVAIYNRAWTDTEIKNYYAWAIGRRAIVI